MKEAGLTHGGFYGHFASRDALVQAALERAAAQGGHRLDPRGGGAEGAEAMIARYLTPAHRDSREAGCAIAALAGDVARLEDAAAQAALGDRVAVNVERLTEALGGGAAARRAAEGVWCVLVGALTLSRVAADPETSDRMLAAGREAALLLVRTAAKQIDVKGAQAT